MSLKVIIELSNTDLGHFRRVMREARAVAEQHSAEDIMTAAGTLLARVEEDAAPDFIRDRLNSIKILIDMVRDEEWQLPDQERARVINALAYFCEPEDIIPDEVPGLGLLDDAIMVELVVRELRHEIEAYRDFCGFRKAQDERGEDAVDREAWLDARRKALHSRMRNRRRRERERRRSSSSGGGSRRSPFSLF
jgi:uncharacterized membrane protein YkvA (DUF1232 family)